MKKILFLLFLSAMLILPSSSATVNSKNGLEVANPNRLGIYIEDLDQHAISIGLSKDDITARVKAKLSQSNIKAETNSAKKAYLYVNINTFGAPLTSFNIYVSFDRNVRFDAGDDTYTSYGAHTYFKGFTGIAESNKAAGLILQALDGLLDQFISDYTDANIARMRKY